jgi:alkylhydroperoxidase family enzyme
MDLGDRNGWNITAALANSPIALKAFTRCIGTLNLGTELETHTREAVILRIGALLGSDYEWGRHVLRARADGLSDATIRGLRDGDLAELSEADAAAVRYIEAVETRSVEDDLWAEVSKHYSTSQLVELTMLGGFYGLVCRFLLALRVELDDDVSGLEMP